MPRHCGHIGRLGRPQPMHTRLWWVMVACLVARPALACSGPDAEGVIALSGQIGLLVWGLCLTATALVFLRAWRPTRGKWRVYWLALPALQTLAVFTFGTARGDCGFMLRDVSYLIGGVTLVSAVLGLWAVRRGIPLP